MKSLLTMAIALAFLGALVGACAPAEPPADDAGDAADGITVDTEDEGPAEDGDESADEEDEGAAEDEGDADDEDVSKGGAGDDLVADVPEVEGASFEAEDDIQEGGRHFFYTSAKAPADLVAAYQAALEDAGWTIEDAGGGGDPMGFASGAGLTATMAQRYLSLNAGGPSGQTFIDLCVWPQQPRDNDCGQNDDDRAAAADDEDASTEAGAITPGLWIGGAPASNAVTGVELDEGWAICFNVSDDGSALVASADCDIDQVEDPPEAYQLEIQVKNDAGVDQDGGSCNTGTGIPAGVEIPIVDGAFEIEYFDGNGDWVIAGRFDGDTATGSARRTFDPFWCELAEWTASPQ